MVKEQRKIAENGQWQWGWRNMNKAKKEDKACRQTVWRRRESEESYEEPGANLSLLFSTRGAQFAHLYNVFN